MPKTPISYPQNSLKCAISLPTAALAFRRRNGLVLPAHLDSINVTAWLYRDSQGQTKIQVNPNIPIADLIRKFGPADTPDAEVGIHSEMIAAQWFLDRPDLTVLQIFSERIPCPKMCGPMLRHHFRGLPWFYYFNRESWRDSRGKLLKRPSDILTSAYGL